ncbi:hypothetical protein GDO78_022830 [Eleutherodactylus coqui]|uniref:Uncharacterized protein n=1 Tax=Eleutherodactylus coqui TaxID=57060 RepID=A0A8J6B964_ELECQ|nr:hypothetical protein GDO78_022830 [Eleutherodactylus coqui]
MSNMCKHTIQIFAKLYISICLLYSECTFFFWFFLTIQKTYKFNITFQHFEEHFVFLPQPRLQRLIGVRMIDITTCDPIL